MKHLSINCHRLIDGLTAAEGCLYRPLSGLASPLAGLGKQPATVPSAPKLARRPGAERTVIAVSAQSADGLRLAGEIRRD